jgi:hypothetical protein
MQLLERRKTNDLKSGWVICGRREDAPEKLMPKGIEYSRIGDKQASIGAYQLMREFRKTQRWDVECDLFSDGIDLIEPSDLEEEFNRLAETWRKDTRMLSFIRQKAMHPAYQKIIGMGKEALPFIFRELKERGGDWIWALEMITRIKPEGTQSTKFKDVVTAWLNWGRTHGFTQ